METLDFVVLILAAGALVDVWFRGSLFENAKAYAEARADVEGVTDVENVEDVDDEDYHAVPRHRCRTWYCFITSAAWHIRTWWNRHAEDSDGFLVKLVSHLPRWLCELMTCWYCLSHHTPYIIALFTFVPGLICVACGWTLLGMLFKLPAYCLAATRAGILINELLPPRARYSDD